MQKHRPLWLLSCWILVTSAKLSVNIWVLGGFWLEAGSLDIWSLLDCSCTRSQISAGMQHLQHPDLKMLTEPSNVGVLCSAKEEAVCT